MSDRLTAEDRRGNLAAILEFGLHPSVGGAPFRKEKHVRSKSLAKSSQREEEESRQGS